MADVSPEEKAARGKHAKPPASAAAVSPTAPKLDPGPSDAGTAAVGAARTASEPEPGSPEIARAASEAIPAKAAPAKDVPAKAAPAKDVPAKAAPAKTARNPKAAAGDRKPRKKKRLAAASEGVGVQFVDWVSEHGPACLLLALVCIIALGALFWFVVFSDFSASADFVYNQF